MQPFWIFFAIAVVLGSFASCCYYVAVWRVVKAGVHVKFLAMPKDTFLVLRQYRDLAYEKGLSLWPINGFWLFSIPALCSAVTAGIYFNLLPASVNNSSAHFPTTSAAMLWVSISSFVIALVFSYRVFRYLSNHGMRLWGWKRWSSDEYTRNDFALATIGWLGFLGGLLMFLFAGSHDISLLPIR
jgi:hypothetical protein